MMNRKENMVVTTESYVKPEVEVLQMLRPLSLLDNGFSADLEADIDINDIEDAGEL